MKPTFYMMIGLPGSGKSTYAREKLDGDIFSSDELRVELFKDINNQDNNNIIFEELNKRIKENLISGRNSILDATNISYKKRKHFLDSLNKIDCFKQAVFIAVPFEECKKRNSERDRVVPEEVLKRMYTQFNSPYYYEGYDSIQVVNNFNDRYETALFTMRNMDFDQNNEHHKLSLGEHCYQTSKYILNKYGYEGNKDLIAAALIHDEGKLFTKDFHDSKGNETKQAHYYNHQYVGAYDSFFFSDIKDHLYAAQLIQWHMHPYISWNKSEKSLKRDKELLGEKLYYDIYRLHEADVAAH